LYYYYYYIYSIIIYIIKYINYTIAQLHNLHITLALDIKKNKKIKYENVGYDFMILGIFSATPRERRGRREGEGK